METLKTDVAVIGGGPAGYTAAIRASQLGYSVILAEKEKLGGICLNWGCIPSKSLITSARMLHNIKKASEFGISGIDTDRVKPDWKKMLEKSSKTVSQLTSGVKMLLTKNNVQILTGTAQVESKTMFTVKESGQRVEFKYLIIATGTYYKPPHDESEQERFITPKELLNIDKIPEKIVIIGAGVVGVEYAILFSMLGSEVTLIEKKKTLMPYLDKDLEAAIRRQLKKYNVRLLLSHQAADFAEQQLIVQGEGLHKIQADIYLWAGRRRANCTGLEWLVKNGLELSGGFIKTDKQGRTTLANIYAAGDINGRYMLAHIASKEGQAAAESIHGTGKDLQYDFMPYNLYSYPEAASIGFTEQQAESRGFITKSVKFPFTANGKAMIENQTDGFIKIIYEIKYGEILGAHILAQNATDLIGEISALMESEATVWELAKAVHPHPTLSETLMEAGLKGIDQPVHIL